MKHSREGPNALGRVPDVPHFDVGAGHREHQPRVAAVFDRNHVVGVTLESCDLLPCYQVPHLAATVCQRQGNNYGEELTSGARELPRGGGVPLGRGETSRNSKSEGEACMHVQSNKKKTQEREKGLRTLSNGEFSDPC